MTSPPRDPRAGNLLRQRIRELFQHLPKAVGGDTEAVHDMRVAGRRLRSALLHLPEEPESKRVRRAQERVRDLVRAAGQSRDLDVGLAVFAAQVPHPSGPAARLKRSLAAAVRRGRAQMGDALLDVEIAGLRRDLRRVVAGGVASAATVRDRLDETVRGEGAEIEAGLRRLGERYDPEVLHRLRIRTRRLRYAFEIGAVIAGRGEKPVLRDLQEQLGAMRDLYVLAIWLRGRAESAAARGDDALAREARRLATRLLRLSHEHHRAFLQRAPLPALRPLFAPAGPSPAPRKEDHGPADRAPRHRRGSGSRAERRRAAPHSGG